MRNRLPGLTLNLCNGSSKSIEVTEDDMPDLMIDDSPDPLRLWIILGIDIDIIGSIVVGYHRPRIRPSWKAHEPQEIIDALNQIPHGHPSYLLHFGNSIAGGVSN